MAARFRERPNRGRRTGGPQFTHSVSGGRRRRSGQARGAHRLKVGQGQWQLPAGAGSDLLVDEAYRCIYTLRMNRQTPGRTELTEIATGCACRNLRRTARTVTQLYDDTLRPSGLRITQFTLLVAVALSEPVPITRLADALDLDRTTLARDLKPLTERGLLEITTGEDKRTRMVRLTVQGREAIARAYPLWQQAQARIVQGSGPDRWQLVAGGLEEVAALALRS